MWRGYESRQAVVRHTLAAVMCVVASGIFLPVSGRATQPSNIQIVNGMCAPSSHTAEGPLGADLTKRQSRFFCDSAILMFFDDYKGHVLIQFVEKESHHSPMLGFSGKVEDDGIMMPIDHIYLTVGTPTTVSDGACKFFFKNHHISGIFCGAAVDETGRRTTAIVVFNAAPRQ
jgi:hypothetical protein